MESGQFGRSHEAAVPGLKDKNMLVLVLSCVSDHLMNVSHSLSL